MASEIKDAFNTAFRDFVTDGVPASGKWNPKKMDARAAGIAVQGAVDTLTTADAGLQAGIDAAVSDAASAQQTAAALDGRVTTLEQTAVSGVHRAASSRVSTGGNIDLAGGGLAAGTTIDGVVVVAGDRVLVRQQTNAAENGIYDVPASGAASRSGDANLAAELQGIATFVEQGTARAGQTWACTATNITLGTTALPFQKIADDAAFLTTLDSTADDIRKDVWTQQSVIAGGVYEPARAINQASIYASYDSNGGTRKQWLATLKMGADDRIDAIQVYLNDEGRTPAPVTIEALLYRQPAALSSSSAVADLSNYELIDSFSGPAAQYFTIGGGVQYVTLPVRSAPFFVKGTRLAYVVRLKDGSGNLLPFGFGRARQQSADEEAYSQGGFSTGTGINAFSGISAGNKIYASPQAQRAAALPTEQGSAQTKLGRRLVPVEGKERLGPWTVDFTRVSFNCRPRTGIAAPGALGFYISQAQNVRYLRLRVFTRPYADGDYVGEAYVLGSGPNDRMVYARDYLASDLYNIDQAFHDEEQFVEMDTAGMPSIGPDQVVMYEVTGYDTDRITSKTFRTNQAAVIPAGEIGLLGGSYSIDAPPSTVQKPSLPHAFMIMEAVRLDDASKVGATPIVERLQVLEPVVEFQATNDAVTLPRMAVWSGNRKFVKAAQTLALTPITGATYPTSDTFDLRYLQRNPISARYWQGTPVVTRTSDGAVLVAGVDYEIDSPQGTVMGLQNVADFEVTVTTQAYKPRVDLITLFAGSGQYQVFEGTAQLADPDAWRPVLDGVGSNGRLAVAEVLVKPDGVEVIDKTAFYPRSMVAYGREAEIEAIRQWNRQRLDAVRIALLRGEDITYVPYGDSISAWTGGSEDAWQTVPNGPSRDTRGSLTVQTVDATLTHLGYPPIVEADGVTHWYGSFQRRTASTLASRYGVAVTVENLGIGGTTAGNGGTGTQADRYGGSNPNRLAGLLSAKGATGLTLVGICFCTNDNDSDALVNDLTVIGRYCLNNGMIPFLIGQPALAYGVTRTEGRQARNDARVMEAARTIPCAYVPLSLITHKMKGASGIFQSLTSGSGGVNHPGAYEHKVYADWIDYMCFQA